MEYINYHQKIINEKLGEDLLRKLNEVGARVLPFEYQTLIGVFNCPEHLKAEVVNKLSRQTNR